MKMLGIAGGSLLVGVGLGWGLGTRDGGERTDGDAGTPLLAIRGPRGRGWWRGSGGSGCGSGEG